MGTDHTPIEPTDRRLPILYLAPWVDIGGSDTATVDWFRFLDRERFCASLITTQPSANRRLFQIVPYADELWELPQLMAGPDFPRFILSFIHTRGVQIVHIMNSRLGFELLPDIAGLPRRPRVVVQLHGEEPDQAGYVRFATTRYGNLVDGFSITTTALQDRLDVYDVPEGKRSLIPIGVDAEREFSPDHVRPVEGLDTAVFHILFAARLTEQKDPGLMLQVAEQLRAAGLRFQLHVVGDGDQLEQVRKEISRRALSREVILHGACVEVAPWYAACDAVLLTSAFETSPTRVAYEAMAMGVPVVAPRLGVLEELITPQTGVLVAPRSEAGAYSDQLLALAADAGTRRRLGAEARDRVRSEFSVGRMAAEHARLYRRLAGSESYRTNGSAPAQPAQLTPSEAPLRTRPSDSPPLVSVIVTCFNQGRYLEACLDSVAKQTYDRIETIVVDDCSTEAETLTTLSRLEGHGQAAVLRLARNRGPCGARNAGIARARGLYLLPLDCDDLLTENAVGDLVAQLAGAGDRIGFIYPNLQYFGNRTDYLEVPSYNLHALLGANQCATTCLFDRAVFDRGLCYPEDLGLGHEDWDFTLTLAEHGIYGEPAQTKTLLCRRHGFSRNDLVDATTPFASTLAARHPDLFARRAVIKGEWNPALSIIALDPVAEAEVPQALQSAAVHQTCGDFELILPAPPTPSDSELGQRLRCLPGPRDPSRAPTLARCLAAARGRYVLATYGSPAVLLSDQTLVEKVLRVLSADERIVALGLAESGIEQPSFRLLNGDSVPLASLGGLCWRATGTAAPPASLCLPGDRPLEALARWLGIRDTTQWRHVSRQDRTEIAAAHSGPAARIGAPTLLRAQDARFREAPPELPQYPPGISPRLEATRSWTPWGARAIFRHREDRAGRYVYTNDSVPPAGCSPDHVLGFVRAYPFAGTVALRVEGETGFVLGSYLTLDDPGLLGFAEQNPLPLLDELRIGRHPATGQQLLVAGDDRLAGVVEGAAVIGYIEPHPILPRLAELPDPGPWVSGLLRSVDLASRRHRYGVGHVPRGLPAGELGALLTEPVGECDPLWISEAGHVSTAPHGFSNGRPSLFDAVRWIRDPLTWKGFSHPAPKLRAMARRTVDSVTILASTPDQPECPRSPSGYLLRSPGPHTVALHGALHPVTGDQLLTTDPSEPARLGYGHVRELGYLIARAPVTGILGPTRPPAPWAARFGQVETAT